MTAINENLIGDVLVKGQLIDGGSYKTGSYIATYMGKNMYPLNPVPEDIDIKDIAHALSNICRWTGHVSRFYSVAQHSVMVSRTCNPEHALEGLLHDASEAYLSDISRPVKYTEKMEGYRSIESKLEKVVAEKFGTNYPMSSDVKFADDELLIAEGFYLFNPSLPWVVKKLAESGLKEPKIKQFDCWLPVVAKGMFMKRFLELNGVIFDIPTEKELERVDSVHFNV